MGFCDLTQIGIYGSNLLSFCGYSIIAPYYPNVAQSYGVSSVVLGVIMAILPLSNFVTSFFAQFFLNRYGQKRMFSIGGVVVGTAIFLFGFLPLLECNGSNVVDGVRTCVNPSSSQTGVFIAVSIILRVIQGFGACFVGTCGFALLAIIYPTEMQIKLGLNQMFIGLGYFVGPLLGTALFGIGRDNDEITGFPPMFWFLGTMLIGFGFFSYQVIKMPKVEKLLEDENNSSVKRQNERDQKFSIFNALAVKEVFMTFLIIVITFAAQSAFQTYFSFHLINQYNVSAQNVGLIYPIPTVGYAPALPTGYMLLQKVEQMVIVAFGTVLYGIGMLFLGPVPFLDLPNKLYMPIIGLVIIGFGGTYNIIPQMPTHIRAVQERNPKLEFGKMADACGAVLNSSFQLGQILGPIIGGYIMHVYNTTADLEDDFGFQYLIAYFGYALIIYGFFYFFFGSAALRWNEEFVVVEQVPEKRAESIAIKVTRTMSERFMSGQFV